MALTIVKTLSHFYFVEKLVNKSNFKIPPFSAPYLK